MRVYTIEQKQSQTTLQANLKLVWQYFGINFPVILTLKTTINWG